MKRLRVLVIAVMLGILGMVSSVSAETVQWLGMDNWNSFALGVDVTASDGSLVSYYTGAGTVNITIDGVGPVQAYCLDLYADMFYDSDGDGDLYNPDPYEVVKTPLPNISPFNEMGLIVHWNLVSAGEKNKAAAIQTAIWKLFYAMVNVGIEVFPHDTLDNSIELDALALINSVDNTDFTLDAFPHPVDPNLIIVLATGPAGLSVTLTANQGMFVANGDVELSGFFDVNGEFSAVIDLGDEVPSLTVTSAFDRPTAYLLESTKVEDRCTPTVWADAQDLIIVLPVPESVTITYGDDYLGCPRTIGFWKHQFRQALLGRKSQVDAITLGGYLPIELPFVGVTVSSFQEGFEILWLGNATMQQRAVQQFFATWLNFLHGEIGMNAMVDIDYDKVPDVTFVEALALFSAAWDAGDFEDAKDIADSINNMCEKDDCGSCPGSSGCGDDDDDDGCGDDDDDDNGGCGCTPGCGDNGHNGGCGCDQNSGCNFGYQYQNKNWNWKDCKNDKNYGSDSKTDNKSSKSKKKQQDDCDSKSKSNSKKSR